MRREAHRTPREGPSWAGARDPHPLAAAAGPAAPEDPAAAGRRRTNPGPPVLIGPHDHGEPATCLGPCPTRRGDSRDFPIRSWEPATPTALGTAHVSPPHSGDRPCGSEAPSRGRSPPSWGRRRRRPWGHQLSVRGGTSDRGTGVWEAPVLKHFRATRAEKPQTCAASLPPTGKQRQVLRFPRCRVLESSRKGPQDRSRWRRPREEEFLPQTE